MTGTPEPAARPHLADAARRLWLEVAAAAAVGLQFGVVESARLRAVGFSVSAPTLLEIVFGHALLGAAVGLPLALLVAAARLVRGGALRALGVLPAAWTLFALAATTVNVRYLRGKLRPESLLVDLGLLLAVVGLAWLWGRRRRSVAATAALLVAVGSFDLGAALWSLGGDDAVPAAAAAAGRAEPGSPDVVIVLLDALRADHMSLYGYPRPTTPRIDRWAAAATVFERAYSTSNWTRPAVASIHTSTMPSRHGMVSLDRALSPELPTLAESFRAAGYRTGFFTVGVNIEPEDGYARGVDHFYFSQARAGLERTPLFARLVFRHLPAARGWVRQAGDPSDPGGITDRVLAWAGEVERATPLFLYVHYMGPHLPYLPPPSHATAFTEHPVERRLAIPPGSLAGDGALDPADVAQMIAQYDAEILQHDEEFDRLLSELERLRGPGAVVVLTSDHGEGFGEHGVWRHGRTLFEEIVRVPLVVHGGGRSAAKRLDLPASLLEIAPTVLELAGLEVPGSMDGVSLVPWLRGELGDAAGDRPVFQENPVFEERGVRTREWAYFEDRVDGGPRRWLFAAADPAQARELAADRPDLAEWFRSLVAERGLEDARRSTDAPALEMDPARKERLRALGYLQ